MNDKQNYTYPRIGLLIDGEWIYDRPPLCDVENPSDETILGQVPRASQRDLQNALESSARGFEIWRKTPPSERAAIMRRTAALVRERAAEIAPIFTLEQGKTLSESLAEIERSATFLDWDAEEIATPLRPYCSDRSANPAVCRPRTSRSGCRFHALECADERTVAQNQRIIGGGMFGHSETGRGNACDGLPVRTVLSGCRPAERRAQCCFRGSGRSFPHACSVSNHASCHADRIDPCRQASDAPGCGDDEARVDGTGRACPGIDRRRRQSRRSRSTGHKLEIQNGRPVLFCPLPVSGTSIPSMRASSRASPARPAA